MSRLREHADVIVIDSSPLAEFADSYAFANVAEAVILCVRLIEINVWSVCGTTARSLIVPVRFTLNGAR